MNAKREKKERITMGGTADEAVFEKAIRENLSPDGVAAMANWPWTWMLNSRLPAVREKPSANNLRK